MLFRNRYDGTRVPGIYFKDKSLTDSSYAQDVNINNIVTGRVSCNIPATRKPLYEGDIIPVRDLQTALQQIADVKNSFAALPASLRARFDNSPEKMLKFVQNPENRDKCIELGIVKGPDKVNPILVKIETDSSQTPVVTESNSAN